MQHQLSLVKPGTDPCHRPGGGWQLKTASQCESTRFPQSRFQKLEPIEPFGRFKGPRVGESGILGSLIEANRGPIVDRETSKKDRRQNTPGVNKKMDRAVEKRAAGKPGETQGAEADGGLSPNLQAHIGRHLRAVTRRDPFEREAGNLLQYRRPRALLAKLERLKKKRKK